jgi:hypothetical protein
MSKKSNKKPQVKKQVKPQAAVTTPTSFGYEEMLGELEAIVTDAKVRLAEQELAA